MTKQFTTYKQRQGHDINGVRPVMIPDESGEWVSRHDAEHVAEQLKQVHKQLATQRQYYEGVISDGNKRMAELERERDAMEAAALAMRDDMRQAREQLKATELESRTVTVNLASRRLPSDYVDGEFSHDDLAAIHNACRLECKASVERCLSAYGIVVKWEAE